MIHLSFIVRELKNSFLISKLTLLSTCYILDTVLRDLYKLYNLNMTTSASYILYPFSGQEMENPRDKLAHITQG